MSTNIVKSDDDCFFFFNATCTKGDACPFRHSSVAYGSDVVCSFWREGKCIKGASCKYRHLEIRKSRNKVECFFERQPGGCKKQHCPFLHSSRPQIRSTGEDTGEGLNSDTVDSIQPSGEPLIPNKFVSDQEIKVIGTGDAGAGGEISFGTEANLNENYPRPFTTPPFSPNSSSTKLLLPTSPSSTAATIGSEPVSFSIDIAEESENEPEEIGCLEKRSIKLTSSNHNVEQNLGIKTLEQIRMEKVFRQNDVNRQTLDHEPTGTSSKQFRIKLKRKSLPVNNNNNTITSTSPGVLTTTTTNTTANENESNPGFGIKSLDEIRREKEQTIQSSEIKMSTDCEKDDNKPKKVVKIKRTHLEIYKTSEPPSKIVKINKPPIAGGGGGGVDKSNIPIQPSIKSPIQATTSTKVQKSPQRRPSLPLRPISTPTPTSSNPLTPPKQPVKLKLKVTPEQSTLTPPVSTIPTIQQPVPVEVKSTNVKLEMKNLTISSNKLTATTTIKPADAQQSVSKLTNRDDNQPFQKSSSHNSGRNQQDDYDFNADADADADGDYDYNDSEEEEDNKYDSDSSSNLSLKSNDKQVNLDENRISSLSKPPSSQQAQESQPDQIIIDDNLTNNLEETNLLSKNTDDDLLEQDDDLLADGESVPEDVAIEDEDDEFLKEIEHVINS